VTISLNPIKTTDATISTDLNTYSAAKALSLFLRKDVDDVAAGLIQFNKGFKLGNFITGAVGG